MKKRLGYLAISLLLVVGTTCAKSSKKELMAYLSTLKVKGAVSEKTQEAEKISAKALVKVRPPFASEQNMSELIEQYRERYAKQVAEASDE